MIFGYGVASGDSLADRVVIWARATPPPVGKGPVAAPGSGYGHPLEVRWEVALSVVGRTRTAPDVAGEVHALRLALVSCSNYTGGWFGAYGAIADRDDLDLVLHVGDQWDRYQSDLTAHLAGCPPQPAAPSS